MPSTTKTWEGSCRDRSGRIELIEAMERLAAANEARTGIEPQRLDSRVGSVILRCPSTCDAFLADQRNRSRVEDNFGEMGGSLVRVADTSSRAWAARLPDARLHGIQWQLHDPRDLYPGSTVVSFVALVLPEIPMLDGQLFEVSRSPEWPGLEQVGTAEFYMGRPSVHLRYYLESFFDSLLAYVKLFFVPDLDYGEGSWSRLVGFPALRCEVRQRVRYQGATMAALRRELLDGLVAAFEEEAASWDAAVDEGPEAPVYVLENDLSNRITVAKERLASTTGPERTDVLAEAADLVLERAEWLRDWPGRASDWTQCISDAGVLVDELLTRRRDQPDLIRLARQRQASAAAILVIDDEDTEQGAVDDELAPPGRTNNGSIEPNPAPARPRFTVRERLEEGLEALASVTEAERPAALEAGLLLDSARVHFHEGEARAAASALERACSCWERVDVAALGTAELDRMISTYVEGAIAVEKCGGNANQRERLLRRAVEQARQARQQGAVVTKSEASAYVELAESCSTRGDAVTERAHRREAIAAYFSLSRGADRYADRWLQYAAEQAIRLSLLEEREGDLDQALQALVPDALRSAPVSSLLRICEIEQSRGRSLEAFEAAVEGLSILGSRHWSFEDAGPRNDLRGVALSALIALRNATEDGKRLFSDALQVARCYERERDVRVLLLEAGVASEGAFNEEDLRVILGMFGGDEQTWNADDRDELEAVSAALASLSGSRAHAAKRVASEFPQLSEWMASRRPT